MIQKSNLFVFFFILFISIQKTLEYNLQDLMLSIHLYGVIYISCFLFLFFFLDILNFLNMKSIYFFYIYYFFFILVVCYGVFLHGESIFLGLHGFF
jgi:hypothetical protein